MSVKSGRERIIHLLSSNPMTISELLKTTNIPDRTLRHCLSALRRSGALVERISFCDMRRKTISIKGGRDG